LQAAKVIKTIQNYFKIGFVGVKSLCIFARSFKKGLKAIFQAISKKIKDNYHEKNVSTI